MNPKYKDLLHLPHPNSLKHPRMDPIDRAAQFSPFSPLTGYDEAISETARETNQRIELDEEARNKLDAHLAFILLHINERPTISITFFKADEKKEGGFYETIVGIIKKINQSKNSIFMENGLEIKVVDIIAINHQLNSISLF